MRLEDKVARAVGSWKFLTFQTIFIATYVLLNTITPASFQFDPFPFTFLNVILSLQAAYTAPILLLSHNRMADQDRQNNQAILDTVKKLEANLITAIEEIDDEST